MKMATKLRSIFKMHPIQEIFKDLQGTKQEIIANLKEVKISKPVLFIAMTARTGSTAFCSLLGKDERIGVCDELFNPRGPIQTKIIQANNKNMLFSEYITYIEKQVSNNYFSFKISWQDYLFFVENDLDKLLFNNSTFLFLDRFDTESQVVSLYYSMETNVWHSDQVGFEKEKPQTINFNIDKLNALTLSIINEKNAWWNYFYSHQINPLVMHYEFFTIDFDSGYKNILRSLDIRKEKNINWEQSTIKIFHNTPKKQLLKKLKQVRFHGSAGLC